jgi:hypothetical protein
MALYPIGVVAAFVVGLRKDRSPESQQAKRRVRDRYNAAKQVSRDSLQAASHRWDLAYYCTKHDVTFLLGGSQVVPPTAFSELLWET